MTNQKAWMFFNTETPLPKNHEYYTEEEIVEAMQKYADQQLILSGVSQQRELLAFIEEVSEFDALVSSTRLRLRAKELLKANCG
jgi:ATP:corrinoid adenosyltransferase